MEIWIGWAANLLIVLSWWRMAYRERYALLLGMFGSLLWGLKGLLIWEWDLITIEVILALLGLNAWRKWGRDVGDTCSVCKRAIGE